MMLFSLISRLPVQSTSARSASAVRRLRGSGGGGGGGCGGGGCGDLIPCRAPPILTAPALSTSAAATATGRRDRDNRGSSRHSRTVSSEEDRELDGDEEAFVPEIHPWMNVDPDTLAAVTGTATAKKFMVAAVVGEMRFLASNKFPIPEGVITQQQLETLVSLQVRWNRVRYIEALATGADEAEIERILRLDRDWPGSMFTEEQVASATTPEQLAALRMAQFVEQKLIEEGDTIPEQPMPAFVFEALMKMERRGEIEGMVRHEVHRDKVTLKEYVKSVARRVSLAEYRRSREDDPSIGQPIWNDRVQYGLGMNTLFFRVLKPQLQRIDNWRMVREHHPWGNPPIVIDLSFLKSSPFKTAKSIVYREIPYALNYMKRCPGRLAPVYLTSFDPECTMCQELVRYLKLDEGQESSYVTLSEKSYLDIFPQKDLLYLSPDSRTDMREYGANDVCIIGGLVGKDGNRDTLTKAKAEGIRHARLPMKSILGFNIELNVDCMLPLLNDFRETGDWLYAFRWLTPRHLSRVAANRGALTQQAEAIAVAHTALSPLMSGNKEEDTLISTAEYRIRFDRIAREHLAKTGVKPGAHFDPLNVDFNRPLIPYTQHRPQDKLRKPYRKRPDIVENVIRSRTRLRE